MNRAGRNEADIQAAQPQAGEQARVPRPHEDGRRPQDAEPSPQARSHSSGREDRREVDRTISARGEGLPREARIRLGSEIRGLLERGERKRTKNVDVFFAASPASHSRLGLIVPKHGLFSWKEFSNFLGLVSCFLGPFSSFWGPISVFLKEL